MRSIVVTGATGFIGTSLVRALRTAGYDIVPISHRDVELTEPGALAAVVGDRAVDAVIHCASVRPHAGRNFETYYRGNILTLCHVLDWMASYGVRNILTFSSVNTYGNVRNTELTEQSPADPVGDYAISKWAADQLLKCRAVERGLTAVNLRLPSVFGPGHGGGIVETCYQHARRNEAIEIFSMGQLWRNLIHVDQIIAACQRVCERWEAWRGYQLFLLGSANALTMENIARRIVATTGSQSRIHLVDTPSPAEADWLLRLDHARQVLDFVPVPLEQALDFYVAQQIKGADAV